VPSSSGRGLGDGEKKREKKKGKERKKERKKVKNQSIGKYIKKPMVGNHGFK
jgi:hypothetical protein